MQGTQPRWVLIPILRCKVANDKQDNVILWNLKTPSVIHQTLRVAVVSGNFSLDYLVYVPNERMATTGDVVVIDDQDPYPLIHYSGSDWSGSRESLPQGDAFNSTYSRTSKVGASFFANFTGTSFLEVFHWRLSWTAFTRFIHRGAWAAALGPWTTRRVLLRWREWTCHIDAFQWLPVDGWTLCAQLSLVQRNRGSWRPQPHRQGCGSDGISGWLCSPHFKDKLCTHHCRSP